MDCFLFVWCFTSLSNIAATYQHFETGGSLLFGAEDPTMEESSTSATDILLY